MDITYLGHASFKLKGKTVSVVTDPFDDSAGKFPKDVDAQIVTITHNHPDHNQVKKVGGSPFVIDGPGEYEVGGVSVVGVPVFHDASNGSERGVNTMYVIEIDGLRIGHLGDLGHKLSQDSIEELGALDVVMVPVGGWYTIDAKTATEVVRQLDPWVVLPMHYQQPGLESKVFEKLTGVDAFLKEMGKTDIVPVSKYSLTAERLPTELQVVVLERRGV